MKMNKHVLYHKIMLSFAATTLALSMSGCSTMAAVLDTPDLSGPDFTNQQAVSKMEDTIKAHAALENTTPGPLQTVCNFEDGDDEETYQCTTLVKDSSIVLYADCTAQQCTATGYDKVEKDGE